MCGKDKIQYENDAIGATNNTKYFRGLNVMKINNEKDFSAFFLHNINNNTRNCKILTRMEGGNLSSGIEDIYFAYEDRELWIELKYASKLVLRERSLQYLGCEFTPAQIKNIEKRQKLKHYGSFVVIYIKEENKIVCYNSMDYVWATAASNKIYAETYDKKYSEIAAVNFNTNLAHELFNFKKVKK